MMIKKKEFLKLIIGQNSRSINTFIDNHKFSFYKKIGIFILVLLIICIIIFLVKNLYTNNNNEENDSKNQI